MPFKFKFLILTSILILYNYKAFSQKGQPVMIGISFHHGFIYNHSPKSGVKGPSLTGVEAMEATIQWQTLGNARWHHNFNYPRWGFSLLLMDLKQKVYGGSAAAVIIHKTIRLIDRDFFEFNIRLGTGLGYVTQLYDPVSNIKDLWVSMNPNAVLQLQLETKYRINPHLYLTLGGTLTHFSNGSLSKPNLGLNIPTASVGIRYIPHPERIKFIRDSIPYHYKKNFLHISFAMGIKSVSIEFPVFYPTYNISVQYGRRINRRSKLLIGLDGFQDNSLYQEPDYDSNPRDIRRLGIYAAHEFVFGHIGFVTGAGYYLYNNFVKRDGNVYVRVGIRYNVSPKIFGMLDLKVHNFTADCLEWGVGYTL